MQHITSAPRPRHPNAPKLHAALIAGANGTSSGAPAIPPTHGMPRPKQAEAPIVKLAGLQE